VSQREKVDQLESTLKVFRAEVDMKLKIMQQILSNRNGNKKRNTLNLKLLANDLEVVPNRILLIHYN